MAHVMKGIKVQSGQSGPLPQGLENYVHGSIRLGYVVLVSPHIQMLWLYSRDGVCGFPVLHGVRACSNLRAQAGWLGWPLPVTGGQDC
jgi:hypothetical protein